MDIPDSLVEEFARGHGVVFVGPELSVDAGLPSSEELAERLAAHFEGCPPGLSFEEVAQFAESAYGREELITRLREELGALYLEPTPIHQLIVQLLANQLFTTNIDGLLEEAARVTGREVTVLLSQKGQEAASRIGARHGSQLQLVKLYGDLAEAGSLVLTSDEVALFPIQRPDLMEALAFAWRSEALLFLGYRADDKAFHRLVAQLRVACGTTGHAFMVVEEARPLAARGGVEVINLREAQEGQSLAAWLAGFSASVTAANEALVAQAGRRRVALPAEPYKSLSAFTRKDTAIFHGREVEALELVRQVRGSRFSLLHGPPGVGKTSLLQAAVLPALKSMGYTVLYLCPGANPTSEWREALVARFGSEAASSLAPWVAPGEQPGGTRLLIVLDQFEGFFVHADRAKRRRFVSELLAALDHQGVHCLLSMRSGNMSRLDELALDAHDPLTTRMRLEPLSRYEARAAIASPAAAFGVQMSGELLDQLLLDLEGPEGVPPTVMSVVCTQLWRMWSRRGLESVTLADYTSARQIWDSYLDQVVAQFGQVQVREAFALSLDGFAATAKARSLLKSMVQVDELGVLASRSLSISEMGQALQMETLEVKGLLGYLVQRSVIRRLPSSTRYYEVHDMLLPKVWAWFTPPERHQLYLEQLLAQATSLYMSHGLLLSLTQLKSITSGADLLHVTQEAATLLMLSAIDHHQEAGQWVKSMDSDHAIKLLAELLTRGKRTQIGRIANALGQTGSPKAIPYLQELLQNQDKQALVSAVDALVALNLPEVVQTVYYAARRESQLPRVVPLIEGLEKLQSEGGFENQPAQLLSLLASDHPNPHARSRAANGLLYLGVPSGIRLIAQLLESEDARIRQDSVQAATRAWQDNRAEFERMLAHYDMRIQLDAIRVLTIVGQSALDEGQAQHGLPELLLQVAREGTTKSVRVEALKPLERFYRGPVDPLFPLLEDDDAEIRGRAAKILASQGADASPGLLAALEDEEFSVRLLVMQALGRVTSNPIVVQLGDEEPLIRVKAAQMLKASVDGTSLSSSVEGLGVHAPSILSAAFLDEVPEVRSALMSAAGLSTELLLTGLTDASSEVRLAAARALEQRLRDRTDGLGSQVVEGLMAALADDDLAVRVAVARALGEVNDPRAIETLVATLNHDDEAPEVRMVVAGILEHSPEMMQQHKDAVDPLLVALTDKAPRVRMAAADALAQAGDMRAIEPLIRLLRDEDYLVRLSAISGLGTLYPLPALVKLGSSEPIRRRQAARELAALPDRRVIGPLLAALSDDSALVTVAVIEALGQIRDPQAVEPLLPFLEDGSPPERIAAITALGELNGTVAVPQIIQIITSESEQSKIRRRAATVLGQLSDWRAVEPLIASLSDNDPQMRMTAADALAQLPDGRSLEPLVATLEDSIPRVRVAAANALGALNDERAAEALIKALDNEEFSLRLAAIRALGALWSMPVLWKLGSTRNAKERGQAASTLASIEDSRAVLPLIATLSDKSPKVRIEAARSLGQLKDARAIEPLRAIKDDKNSRVRMEVARALRQLRRSHKRPAQSAPSPKPLPELHQLPRLESENPKVRAAAAASLGQSKDQRAVQPLIEALADPAPAVRLVVVRALERLNDQRAVSPLVATLADEDTKVRWATISALGVLWERLVLVQLGSESEKERLQGLQAIKSQLSATPQPAHSGQLVQPLIVTLRDSVPAVQMAAANALSETASVAQLVYREAIDPLLRAVAYHSNQSHQGATDQSQKSDQDQSDPRLAARLALLSALGASRDQRAISPLQQMLQDDQAPVRWQAMKALGILWQVPLLGRLGDSEASVREGAANYLTRDLQPSAVTYRTCVRSVEPLLVTLRDDVAAVRGEAAKALWSLGSNKMTKDEVVGSMIEGLSSSKHKDPNTRRHVARILGQLRDRRAVKPLMGALMDEDADVRTQAAASLRLLGNHDGVQSMLSTLRDQDPEKRQRAASVLGQLRDQQAVQPLMTALQDTSPLVRLEAARSLGQLSDRRAVAALENTLRDPAHDVRLGAMRALAALWNIPPLAQLGAPVAQARIDAARTWPSTMHRYIQSADRRGLNPLLVALSDEVPEVRIAVAATLGRIKDKRAVNALVKALHDQLPSVQNAVAKALKELEDVRDVEQMVHRQPAQPKPRNHYRREEYLKQRSTLRALGALWNQAILAQLGSEKLPLRIEAAQTLGQSGDPQGIKPLIMALSDEASEVQCAAAAALGQHNDERVIEALIGALREKDNDLLVAVATSLGQLGDRRAVNPLRPLLKHPESTVRIAVASALGHFANTDSVTTAALQAALEDEAPEVQQAATKALATAYQLPRLAELTSGSALVRIEAAKAIAEAGDQRAVDPLILALKAEQPPEVQRALIDALVQLGDSRATPTLIELLYRSTPPIQLALISALGQLYGVQALIELGDDDQRVRLFAASALGRSHDMRAIKPLLITLLLSHKQNDDAMRLATTRALGQLYHLPEVVQLGDEQAQTRQTAAALLAQQKNKRTVDPLIAALGDQDANVRRLVANALGTIGDPRAVVPLLTTLRDPNGKVRGQAAKALQQVGPSNIDPLLTALREEQNGGVRKHLARILGPIGDPRAIEPLIDALQDDNAEVRKNAAISLRGFSDQRGLHASLEALQNPDPIVRHRAASVLGQLRNDRALRPLISALRDNNPQVRQEAARALGQLRNRQGAPGLIGALQDPDPEVRRRAANALKLLEDKRALKALKAARSDPNPTVQQAVSEALRILQG